MPGTIADPKTSDMEDRSQNATHLQKQVSSLGEFTAQLKEARDKGLEIAARLSGLTGMLIEHIVATLHLEPGDSSARVELAHMLWPMSQHLEKAGDRDAEPALRITSIDRFITGFHNFDIAFEKYQKGRSPV